MSKPTPNVDRPAAWYTSASRANPPCVLSPPNSCDEYPFYATAQNNGHSPPVFLDGTIPGAQNSAIGGRLGNMYTACGISPASAPLATDGDPFIVIPVPYSGVDTTYICSPSTK